MDRLWKLSNHMLLSFGLSPNIDKSKDEKINVAGKRAGSDLSELADASNDVRDSETI